jgi:hypothetical protein
MPRFDLTDDEIATVRVAVTHYHSFLSGRLRLATQLKTIESFTNRAARVRAISEKLAPVPLFSPLPIVVSHPPTQEAL